MIQPKEQILRKWQSLCSEQEQGGQSAAAFCRTRELRPSQFYYWKKRVREAAMPQFVEVRVRKPAMTPTDSRVGLGATIELRLGNGRRLMVGPEFDASHLRALLAVVEAEG
ncbi:MAG TPA: hypothetical protein VI636_09710 [Candidatus Angelobacter sp.]